MVGVGSITATPSTRGELSIVTGVTRIAEVQGATLSLVRSHTVGQPQGSGLVPETPAQPVSGQGPIRLIDPRLLNQIPGVEPLGPAGAAAVERLATGEPDPQDAVADDDANPLELSAAERRVVDRLRQNDGAVRQEENTHAANAGQFASAPQYTYTTGPDGRRYAIAGQVTVRAVSNSGDSRQAERALNIVRNAALSPNAPSNQDLSAARSFSQAAGRVAEAYAKPGESSVRPGAFDLEV